MEIWHIHNQNKIMLLKERPNYIKSFMDGTKNKRNIITLLCSLILGWKTRPHVTNPLWILLNNIIKAFHSIHAKSHLVCFVSIFLFSIQIMAPSFCFPLGFWVIFMSIIFWWRLVIHRMDNNYMYILYRYLHSFISFDLINDFITFWLNKVNHRYQLAGSRRRDNPEIKCNRGLI